MATSKSVSSRQFPACSSSGNFMKFFRSGGIFHERTGEAGFLT
jgi:hypothetical protein